MDDTVTTMVSFFAIGIAVAVAARFIFVFIMEKDPKKNDTKNGSPEE